MRTQGGEGHQTVSAVSGGGTGGQPRQAARRYGRRQAGKQAMDRRAEAIATALHARPYSHHTILSTETTIPSVAATSPLTLNTLLPVSLSSLCFPGPQIGVSPSTSHPVA